MTVQRLIDILNNLNDKSREVEVALNQWNKVHPVAYLDIQDNDYSVLQTNGFKYRIEVRLPTKTGITERKSQNT